MKNLIKIIFVLSFLLPVCAQGQAVTWQKWYDYNNYEDNGEDVIQTFDGGYLILSNNYISAFNYSSLITKINENGIVLWQKLFDSNLIGGPLICDAVTQVTDSGFVISGGNRDSTLLIRTDNLGEINWVKKFTRPGYQGAFFSDHKITIDGGIIACGTLYGSSSIGYLVKTDSNGNLEWDSIYSFTTDIIRIIQSSDNFLYMLGYGTTLTKTTGTGEVVWKKDFFLPNRRDLVENLEGNIFIGGGLDSMILYKIDSAGLTIFQNSYFKGVLGCESMCLTKEGNILLAGISNVNDAFLMAVSKIDKNGNLIFNKNIPSLEVKGNFSFLPRAVNATNDSGFIFTGFTDYPPTYYESNIYATKTDSLCNAPLIVNVYNTNSIIPDEIVLYQNYPNPFNPETKINFELSKPAFVTLKIYDLKGSLIKILLKEIKNTGKHEVIFNVVNYGLPSGVYFYQLSSSEVTITKRMLLIK